MRLCLLSGHTPQAYYQQLRKQRKAALGQELIIREVIAIRKVQKRLGGRKLHCLLGPFLQRHGLKMGRDAFFSLLREHRLLVAKRRRNKPQTTFSSHWMRKYPDLRAAQPEPSRPQEVWVSDITYIRLAGSDAYLSLVTDAYSRKIVGYHLSADLGARGCVQALQMALSERKGPAGPGLMHHSDRGVQYCSSPYVGLLREHKVAISMTQRSDPRDNAIAERVNGILKGELLETVFTDLPAAKKAVEVAVNTYNYLRPHSSISMLTPALAHSHGGGVLRRCWKNYYKKKEVVMDQG